MTEHFYITSRLAKVEMTDNETARVQSFVKNLQGKQAEQTAFFNYCKQWKMAPWIFSQLDRQHLLEFLSEQTKQDFAAVHALVKTENENRNAAAVQLMAELIKENIDVAILKGNLFIHTVYHDTGYKKMNDFDILIHIEDWDRVQDIYLKLGYIPLGFGWGGEKQAPAKFSHAGMAFISSDFKCIVGALWGLKSPTTSYRVDIGEAWRTAKEFDFLGVKVKQLSPAYNLLHLVLHMGIYKCGIRDCMDVYNLLLAERNLDEAELIELFKKSNAIEKAYFTLKLVQLCSDAVSETLLAQLKPRHSSYHTRRLEARLAATEKSGDMQVSYHDYFHDVEKEVIYFNLVPHFHQKLFFYHKIYRAVFLPKKLVTLKLSDKAHEPTFPNKFSARLKAPGLGMALIAQEIGWGYTILLLLKITVDQVVSLKNYFIKKESYFDYLAKRGVSRSAIENVVKNIQ